MSRSRRRAATPHANRGRQWEQLLELHHKRLQAQGVAVVFRTPPPVRLIAPQKGGRWLAVLTSEGPPDYTALVLGPDGPIPVAAEAKDSQKARWSLGELQPHQGKALQAWHDLGGLACVLLRHQPTRTCYVLPWAHLGPVWQRWRAGRLAGRRAPPGSASLGAGQLASLGVPWREGEGYLQALLACWQPQGTVPCP